MPDLSGMELIRTLAHPPMVIFTTAYSEHAVQGFELDAIDYLLKPFSLARFLKACNKAYEQQSLRSRELSPGAVFIKSGYEQVRVELADILYAESMGNYVRFVLSGQAIVSRLTMNEAESLLPGAGFIRIHRSYLAAKEKITKIDKQSVWVGETELPTSSAYSREIEQLTSGRRLK
jgi:DNA-binding LytR/AlgR family response regulator